MNCDKIKTELWEKFGLTTMDNGRIREPINNVMVAYYNFNVCNTLEIHENFINLEINIDEFISIFDNEFECLYLCVDNGFKIPKINHLQLKRFVIDGTWSLDDKFDVTSIDWDNLTKQIFDMNIDEIEIEIPGLIEIPESYIEEQLKLYSTITGCKLFFKLKL